MSFASDVVSMEEGGALDTIVTNANVPWWWWQPITAIFHLLAITPMKHGSVLGLRFIHVKDGFVLEVLLCFLYDFHYSD